MNEKPKSITLTPVSPYQVRNKLARVKVCCVVSFPKFLYNDTTDLLPTCCGLVGDMANYLDMSR